MEASERKLKKTAGRFRLRAAEVAPEDHGRNHVFFSLAGEKYALGITNAQEIIKPKEITEIPFAPWYVMGVINVRGKIIPVVDLRKRFNLPAAPVGKSTRIIIVNHEESNIGVMVDEVSAVQPIPEKSIEPSSSLASSRIEAEYFEGIAGIDGGIVGIINIRRALEKPDSQPAKPMPDHRFIESAPAE